MDQSEQLTLTTVLNPFEPRGGRDVRCVLHSPGKTVHDYLQEAGVTYGDVDGIDYAVSINGRVLSVAEISVAVPAAGDCVAVCARPHDGGGGGKDIIKQIAMIAVMIVAVVAAPYVAAGIMAATGIGSGVGMAATIAANALVLGSGAAIYAAGSMLVNTILPSPKVDSGSYNWGEQSSTYAWNTTSNLLREGIALPVLYGTMLLTPPVIAAHVRAAADGTEFLNVLYALGEGPLGVELDADYDDLPAVYINDQHHSVFARDVTLQSSAVKIPGTASASSEKALYTGWSVEYSRAAFANDGVVSYNRAWVPDAGDGSPWWRLDLGSGNEKAANVYKIAAGNGVGWTLAGSNDGSSWTTLDTQSSQSTGTTLTRYTFTNTTEYRYYRLTGLSYIYEFELYVEDAEQSWSTATVIGRDGTNDQSVIPEFARTYSMETSWSAAKVTTDYTERELTGTAIAGIVVGISFPYGLYMVDDAGNKKKTSVSITIQYCTYSGGWGSWTDWDTFEIAACVVGAHKWTRELENLTPGQYKVRVKFSAQPETTTQYVNTAYWEYTETMVADELTYPNTALLGLCVIATDQLSGGMPRTTALVTRDVVSVDVSGTPTDKPANNPAWAAYDMLANERYGAGVDTDNIIYADFSEWADYCDDPEELDTWAASTAYTVGNRLLPTTPKGLCYRCTTAGTSDSSEPTWPDEDGDTVTDGTVVWEAEDYGFRINIAFDQASSIAAALADIAVAGHGTVVQRGCKYSVIIEQPADPTQAFGMGNIVKGSLKTDYLDLDKRANCVEITYWDRLRDYKRTVIEVRSSGFDSGTDAERNAPAVVLYGCTSRRAAIKYGRFLLREIALITKVISFEAGVDAIAVQPGDVFLFSHDVPEWKYSGRLIAVSPSDGASVTQVTLDQEIYCETTKTYQIQIRQSNTSDTLITKTLQAVPSNGNYSTFTFTSAATGTILPEDIFIFGESTEDTKQFRCLSITRGQDQHRRITGAVYDEDLYTDTEEIPQPEAVATPTGVENLRVAEVFREGVLVASLTWDGRATDWNVTVQVAVDGVYHFDSVVNTRQQNWVEIPVTKGVPHRFTVRSVFPAASDQVDLTPVATREWDLELSFDQTFDDNKADRSHRVTIGWHDKDHRDVSDCTDWETAPDYGRGGTETLAEVYHITQSGGTGVSPDVLINFWKVRQINDGKAVFSADVSGTTYYLWYSSTTTKWAVSKAVGSFPDNIGWESDAGETTPVPTVGGAYTPKAASTGNIWPLAGESDSGYAYSRRWPWSTTGIQRFVTDYRDIGNYLPWYVKINIGDGLVSGSLTWDLAAIPVEYPLYLVECDSDGIPTGSPIDMSSQASVAITADTWYKVYLSDSTSTFDLTLVPGWNLVSTPLYPTTPDPDVVFDDSDLDEVQVWDLATEAMVDAKVIEPKEGLWIHNNGASDVDITVTGWRPPSNARRYLQGPDDDASSFVRECIGFCEDGLSNIFPSGTKGFLLELDPTTGQYVEASTVEDGVGYWIDVSADCKIIVKP